MAVATGIILDPVYSGKAIHGLMSELRKAPEAWAGRRVLFIHTGGLLVSAWAFTCAFPLIACGSRACTTSWTSWLMY